MEDISYRRATATDIPLLVELRAAFLAEVSGANPKEPALLEALARYFEATVPSGEFISFLAVAGNKVIGASGLVYHRYPPSTKNLGGVEAYIMNMYTMPAWRGRGIASALLQELIAVARQSNCRRIRLHAISKAVPIYTRADFIPASNEMYLDL